MANTVCHSLLERYISFCPSRQTPEYLMLPQRLQPKQLHHLHTGPSRANPSPPGQPQELTPVNHPHAEVEMKPRGSVAEEDPNLSQQLSKLWIKSARSTKADSVSMEYIKGH